MYRSVVFTFPQKNERQGRSSNRDHAVIIRVLVRETSLPDKNKNNGT